MTNISMKPISMQWVTAQLLLSMTCVSVTASLHHEEERAGCLQSGGQRQSRSFLATESKSLLGKDSTNEEETDGLSKHCTYECVCTEGLEWLDYQLLDQLYSLKYIQNTACCFYFCSAPQDRLTTEKCLTVGRISPIITLILIGHHVYFFQESMSQRTFYFRQWNYKEKEYFQLIPF